MASRFAESVDDLWDECFGDEDLFKDDVQLSSTQNNTIKQHTYGPKRVNPETSNDSLTIPQASEPFDHLSEQEWSDLDSDPEFPNTGPPQATNSTDKFKALDTPAVKPQQTPSPHIPSNYIKPQGSSRQSDQTKADQLPLDSTEPHSKEKNSTTDSVDTEIDIDVAEPSTPVPIVLSDEQKYIIDLALNGDSIFYTGAAGTGKSLLLGHLIQALKDNGVKVAVTSSTGLAALNIGGTTLHKFAGIGLGKEEASTLVKRIKKNGSSLRRWIDTSVLIIDEISMVDGDLFTKLEYIACSLRKNNRPFGNMQLICTGDFLQLPPVAEKVISKNSRSVDLVAKPRIYCFDTEAWRQTIKYNIVLKQNFRQKGDDEFINLLNSMRLGKLTPQMIAKLHTLQRPVNYKDGIKPTALYATRNRVQAYNHEQLKHLKGRSYTYVATDQVFRDDIPIDFVKKRLDETAYKTIELRQGCQVMLSRNMTENSCLVNGILGRVIGFLTLADYEKVQAAASEKKILKESPQFHKMVRDCQLENEKKEAKDKKEGPESHVKYIDSSGSGNPFPVIDFSLDTLGSRHMTCIVSRNVNSITLSGSSSSSTRNHKNSSELFQLPRLSTSPDSQSSLDALKARFLNLGAEFKEDAARIQLPLIYGWAMSIHKAQGQTLPRVRVDLADIFEDGHAYVAISRATSTKTLQILNFRPSKVTVDPKVVEFYNTLESVNTSLKVPKNETLDFPRKKKKEVIERLAPWSKAENVLKKQKYR